MASSIRHDVYLGDLDHDNPEVPTPRTCKAGQKPVISGTPQTEARNI